MALIPFFGHSLLMGIWMPFMGGIWLLYVILLIAILTRILRSNASTEDKLLWVIVVILLPIFGPLLWYLIVVKEGKPLASLTSEGARLAAAGTKSARLVRPTGDRMIAGVCAGAADHLGLDPSLVRIVFAIATLATGMVTGITIYIIAWIIIPEEGKEAKVKP